MKTTDETKLFAAGFILEARLGDPLHGDLWRRDDQPSRSYWTSEAVELLDEQDKEE